MNVLKQKITDLTINPINPREITKEKFDKLVESILVFPKMLYLREIVVDKGLVILGGNMRCRALLVILTELTIDKIRSIIAESRKYQYKTDLEVDNLVEFWDKWRKNPVVEVKDGSDLTEDEKREFVIKDNVSFGAWEWDELANNWDPLDLEDWGLDNEWKEDPDDNNEEEQPGSGSAFEVVVSCETEAAQTILYNELKERGYNCKVKSV